MDRTQVKRFNTIITQNMFSIPLSCIVVVTYNYAHGMTFEWSLTNQIKQIVKQNTIYANNSEIGFFPNFSTYVLNFIKNVNDLKLR